MSAGRICSRVVATAWPTETVRIAAQRMAEDDVGTLVVFEPDGVNRALGILTDRDIAIRCVGAGLNPAKTPVSRIMTAQVHSVDEAVPIEDALAHMAREGTRRLVVTGKGGATVGILSLDDVLEHLSQETGFIGRLLQKQAPHIPA